MYLVKTGNNSLSVKMSTRDIAIRILEKHDTLTELHRENKV